MMEAVDPSNALELEPFSRMSQSRYASAMRRENLRTFFESSPTAKLLRSDNAPLVIDFLNQTFKTGELISVGQSDLRIRLSAYQEVIHESDPQLFSGPPERYLAQWADAGWLQRFLEATSNEPQFQLTRYAEEAIRFVDATLAKSKSMVGTESRLRLIIETLEDIVRGASADPQRRLDYLRAQRAEIDREIESIESGKSIQVYRPSQIRERFQTAVDLLRALQSDFRAVEERFQSIAQEVRHLQATGHDSRGGILGYALDAEDMMKQQDEGISFFAFVAFLFSPTQQAALRKNIEEVQSMVALADEQEGLSRVRRMVPALLAEAEKVMKTTARLSTTLRRLLDAQATAHRIRLANVLREIKQTALQLRTAPPQNIHLEIAAEADIGSPLARTFWTPASSFDVSEPVEHTVDIHQLQKLADQFSRMQRLDFRRLRNSIREATHDGTMLTLGSLLNMAPVETGVVELLGYLQIAHDDGHRIDSEVCETVTISQLHGHPNLQVVIPKITFIPKAKTSSTGKRPK